MSLNQQSLAQDEMKTVFRSEYELRASYQLQGELEEASQIIRQLKAKILLAAPNRQIAERFFALLEIDSHKIDFLEVYQAGKDSFAAGETIKQGVYRFLRRLALTPEQSQFERELQQVYAALLRSMPDEETRAYPEYLLAEYRATHSAVNNHIEDFFRLGYEAKREPRKAQ